VIQTQVTGAVELRYVARLVQRQRVAGLKKELAAAQRKAFAPLLPAIKLEAATLPSGYAPIMARAVKVSVRTRALETVAVVYARGRTKERDVATVDRGRLRHPLYGNRGRWFTTHVRPGFVDRPARKLGERIATDSLDALERVAQEIARG
jgi:hypothetical protein